MFALKYNKIKLLHIFNMQYTFSLSPSLPYFVFSYLSSFLLLSLISFLASFISSSLSFSLFHPSLPGLFLLFLLPSVSPSLPHSSTISVFTFLIGEMIGIVKKNIEIVVKLLKSRGERNSLVRGDLGLVLLIIDQSGV